jgi:hypothetical protein
MATNGMTINGLNPLSALTADDKIPVWDTGASGEPTKEITAQNMANSVKSLAGLPNTTEMNAAIAQSTAYERIPANSDLNDYTSEGKFYIATDSDASNIANTPSNSSGKLIVIATSGTSYVTQIYIRSSADQSILVRTRYGGSWNNWYAISNKTLSFTDVTVGAVTIGSGGYVNIQSYKPSGTIAFVQVLDYDHGTGALSVDVGGNYLSGTPGNVTGLKLRYFMFV